MRYLYSAMTRKEKHENCDVLISGGGVPGLTLATLLGAIGLRVTVIDPHPPQPLSAIRPEGRTAALMAGSVNILKSTGAWDQCAKYGAALETLAIVEQGSRHTKPVRADFRAGDAGLPCFGVNIPNSTLRAAMAERCAEIRGVELLSGAVESFAADDFGITASLNDGTAIRARLLVGADGRNSKVRESCGINVWERAYGQKAITCLIRHSRSHGNISTEFHRPGGPFTIVPMPGHVSSIVWVEYDDDADAFMKLRRQDFEQALQDRTEGLLGTVHLETTPEAWPLKALRAENLIAPRVALMAEAAHVVHPLGAQGLNLSLRDAATLAEEIADAARNGLDIGSHVILRQYEFRRRADILTRSLGTDNLTRMVSNDIGILRHLRRAGLKTVDGIPPLRRFAMHEGVTPGYDDSRLSRGEKL